MDYTQSKDAFSKYRFPENRLADLEITYVHRGAPNDEMTINGGLIQNFGNNFFEYTNAEGFLTHIPYHRIKVIRDVKKQWDVYKDSGVRDPAGGMR